MRLEHVLRAAVLSAAAIRCDDEEVTADASADASFDALDAAQPDVHDASVAFVTDVGVPRCDAGDPTLVDACGGCCVTVLEHCAISPDDFADDAGALWNCDRYCPNAGANAAEWGCRIVGADLVTCFCTGRRFEGYEGVSTHGFAEMARLEAASVFSFERMHSELAALGASSRLLARVRRARCDERRHARMMTRIAHRFGERVEAVDKPAFRARGVEAMAIENAVEGCVRELFGAAVATWHGAAARDPELRRTFRAIARDETRHAELALRVAAFLSTKLDAVGRVRTRKAREDAVRRLERDVARSSYQRALFEAVFRPNQ